MKMTVRICLLATVLVALGTTSVFGQIVFNVGAPAGTPYNGPQNFNFAVNREGNRELMPAISVCSNTPGGGGAPAPAVAATFDKDDLYTITVQGTNNSNSPTLTTLGALGAGNVQVTQQNAGAPVAVDATAAMVAQPVVNGVALGPPLATVTLHITATPAAGSGGNCITISNLRFDIANTAKGTTPGPPDDGTTYGVTVTQTSEQGGPAITGAVAVGNPAPAAMNAGMPNVAPTATSGLATVKITLGSVGAVGVANPTGFTTGNAALSTATINAGSTAATNPPNGLIVSTIPSVVQNSGGTASGTVSVQQNPIATNTSPNGPFIPIAAGGGLFRGFTAAGPDVTTFLNSSGATTGTQVQIIVSGMPTGSTVTFPATASSSSGLVVWNLALVGSGTLTAPGGTVTYMTTTNEGTAYSLNGTAGVGASIDIPYTVSVPTTGSASGNAKFIIQVGPPSGTATPSYNAINDSSVKPNQQVPTVGQWALFRVAPNTSQRIYPYALVFGAAGKSDSYDTGIVLDNTGRLPSTSTGTVSNSGQDGTFTIYLISSNATVASIKSDAATFPGATLLTAGKLLQGNTWQALLSEITKAAGLTGDWKGYVVINADFPNSAGFAFISQFANVNGGATMGYIAQ